MGWTSSGDTQQQVRLRFASKEEAIAYCEHRGIAYRVFDPKQPKRRVIAYADNFAFSRRTPWTHCRRASRRGAGRQQGLKDIGRSRDFRSDFRAIPG